MQPWEACGLRVVSNVSIWPVLEFKCVICLNPRTRLWRNAGPCNLDHYYRAGDLVFSWLGVTHGDCIWRFNVIFNTSPDDARTWIKTFTLRLFNQICGCIPINDKYVISNPDPGSIIRQPTWRPTKQPRKEWISHFDLTFGILSRQAIDRLGLWLQMDFQFNHLLLSHSSVLHRLVLGHELILKNERFKFKHTMFPKLFGVIASSFRYKQ